MKVLVAGQIRSPVTSIIRHGEDQAIEYANQLNIEYLRTNGIEFIVSYRFRHIIQQSVLDYLPDRVVNLHISFLPWNRGADPNLWSFLEDTPKGMTIHYVDAGIDTGDIIAQRRVKFTSSLDTLASTYEELNQEIIDLFEETWPSIAAGKVLRRKQPTGGTFHRLADRERFGDLLAAGGWNTPVADLVGRCPLDCQD